MASQLLSMLDGSIMLWLAYVPALSAGKKIEKSVIGINSNATDHHFYSISTVTCIIFTFKNVTVHLAHES